MEKDYKPKHLPQKSLVTKAKTEKQEKESNKEQKSEIDLKKAPVQNTPDSKAVQTAPVNEKTEKQEKAKEQSKITKKEEAVAKALSLHASKKHLMYISNFIKNKPIDQAIKELEEVIKFKRAIPFKGEIPHRKNPGIMSGRYPINASKLLITVLKGLKGNVLVNGLDLEKTRIYFASASWASRPPKKGGMRFKRTNIILKAKEFPIEVNK